MRPIVAMDFVSDLDLITIDRLRQRGYRHRGGDDPAQRFWMLLSHTQRGILPIASRVHYSAEILTNPRFAPHSAVVAEIAERLSAGETMRPYLSKLAVRLRGSDPLLDHWGIHHVHVSSIATADESGFVARADYLLFLRQDESDVYLIDIVSHAERNNFVNLRLLQIISDNWPNLLASHALVTGQDLTGEEIKCLRKKNVNVALNVGGRAVMSGPVMSNGVPMLDHMRYVVMRESLVTLEGDIRGNLPTYFPRCAVLANQGDRRFFTVRLLDVAEECLVLREVETGHAAHVPKPYGF